MKYTNVESQMGSIESNFVSCNIPAVLWLALEVNSHILGLVIHEAKINKYAYMSDFSIYTSVPLVPTFAAGRVIICLKCMVAHKLR